MAIHNLLELWKLTDKVQTLSFDICQHWTLLLEDKIGRELLWLACRHYVMSLAKVFTLCCGPSNSPNIPIFQTYKAAWESVIQDWMSYPALIPIMKQHSVFSRSLLKENQIQRSEMTTKNSLSWKWLSWKLAFNNSLESPGPIHHASWMAKLLYAINIYLFVINVVYSI